MIETAPLPTSVPAALAAAKRRDAGRPLVTYYDDSSGERIELSVATFDNWASKIANLIGHELMLGPGDTVGLQLPVHWQPMVITAGAWTAGLTLVLDRTHPHTGAPLDLRVVGPAGLAPQQQNNAAARSVLACSLQPLGSRFADPLPAGWLDFAVEVPPQPDLLVTAIQARSDGVALTTGDEQIDHATLVRLGATAAHEMGLAKGGRLITDYDLRDQAGVVTTLVAACAVDASVVLVAPTSPERRTAIAAQERATVSRWSA